MLSEMQFQRSSLPQIRRTGLFLPKLIPKRFLENGAASLTDLLELFIALQ